MKGINQETTNATIARVLVLVIVFTDAPTVGGSAKAVRAPQLAQNLCPGFMRSLQLEQTFFLSTMPKITLKTNVPFLQAFLVAYESN